MADQRFQPHGGGGGAGDSGGFAQGQLTLLPAAGPQVRAAPPPPASPAISGGGGGVAAVVASSQLLLPHSLGGLRQRLSRQGMADVRYMIVNEQAPLSRAMFGELQRQAPPGVPVFQQQPQEPDVWQLLGGDKDDFLVYDR